MTVSPASAPAPRRLPLAGKLAAAVAVVVALAFVFVVNAQRFARVNYVTNTPTWSVDAPVADPASPTGYDHERRVLIVPGRHAPSYDWIASTQRHLAGRQPDFNRIAYDNFPHGREGGLAWPYRAWFTSLARLDHALTGTSLGRAVERAAWYADPLLQALFIAAAAGCAGLRWGGVGAGVTALLGATLFPLAGNFQAAAPDHHSLAWALAGIAVLATAAADGARRTRLWFATGGACGALCLWTDPATGEQLLVGLLVGGGAAALWPRRTAETAGTAPAWRTWGLSGAGVLLAGGLLERGWTLPGWDPLDLHPLHAAAWLGVGEILHQLAADNGVRRQPRSGRAWAWLALALVAVAALPVAKMKAENGHWLSSDPYATELVNFANGIQATSLREWLRQDGASSALWAVLLPLAVVPLALVALFTLRRAAAGSRRALLLCLGPVALFAVVGCVQLRVWSACDAAAITAAVLVVVLVEQSGGPALRWVTRSIGAVILWLGVTLLPPPAGARNADPLDATEVQAVIERDLAYWLRQQGGAETPVVFTTPTLSESLAYYGGANVVVSSSPRNSAGFSAAIRLASASTWPEVSALVEGRGITHLILPSWDNSLGRFAQLGRQLPPDAGVPRDTLYAFLQTWNMPPWLRLQAYHAPDNVGLTGYQAVVFARAPEQDEILGLCRLADYLVEMERPDQLPPVEAKLRLYPRSLPALAALAQVQLSLGNAAGCRETLAAVRPLLARRASRTLPLDRRIGLAALLVQSDGREEARELLQSGLAELDGDRLRTLTAAQLVRLLALADIFKLTLPDPALRAQALALLPPALRDKLTRGRQP